MWLAGWAELPVLTSPSWYYVYMNVPVPRSAISPGRGHTYGVLPNVKLVRHVIVEQHCDLLGLRRHQGLYWLPCRGAAIQPRLTVIVPTEPEYAHVLARPTSPARRAPAGQSPAPVSASSRLAKGPVAHGLAHTLSTRHRTHVRLHGNFRLDTNGKLPLPRDVDRGP